MPNVRDCHVNQHSAIYTDCSHEILLWAEKSREIKELTSAGRKGLAGQGRVNDREIWLKWRETGKINTRTGKRWGEEREELNIYCSLLSIPAFRSVRRTFVLVHVLDFKLCKFWWRKTYFHCLLGNPRRLEGFNCVREHLISLSPFLFSEPLGEKKMSALDYSERRNTLIAKPKMFSRLQVYANSICRGNRGVLERDMATFISSVAFCNTSREIIM